MALTPEQIAAASRDPNWDPIYQGDQFRRQQETTGDILTLGLGDFRGQTARQRATEELMGVGLPEFSRQGFEWQGDYNPNPMTMPESAQVTLADESPDGRAAMLEALQRMGEQTDQAVGSQQDLDRVRAMNDAAQFAQGREGMIRQDAMRRGQVGGAADMIGRQVAAQAAANRNQEGGLQSAQMAALQRLAGTQAQGALGGNIRAGDQALAFRNQNAINQFNLGNVAARNATRAANTATGNEAMRYNLGGRQDISNRNVGRGDDISQAIYGARANNAANVANAMTGQAAAAGQQGNNIRSTAGNALQAFLRAMGAGGDSK